jgi:hypothetical protein
MKVALEVAYCRQLMSLFLYVLAFFGVYSVLKEIKWVYEKVYSCFFEKLVFVALLRQIYISSIVTDEG